MTPMIITVFLFNMADKLSINIHILVYKIIKYLSIPLIIYVYSISRRMSVAPSTFTPPMENLLQFSSTRMWGTWKNWPPVVQARSLTSPKCIRGLQHTFRKTLKQVINQCIVNLSVLPKLQPTIFEYS